MAKKSEPSVEVWGLEEIAPDSRRLKLLDFARGLGDSLWAYPVFTTREAALDFADMLSEDAAGPDAEKFRQMTRECIRRVRPGEIPRAAKVMVNVTALRDPGDNVGMVVRPWGAFYDELVAELN
jgi:hypothetical protein